MQLKKNITAAMLLVFSIFAVNSYVPIAYSSMQASIAREVGDTYNKEVSCLAENIYYEAGRESYEGKLAVAQVTLNRANSGKFPPTVCGVVHQKDNIKGTMICQFSWVCMAVKAPFRNKYLWEESLRAARTALTEPVAHQTIYASNALYYHAAYVDPGWHLKQVARIGNHVFYKGT